ncbi:hypothetical protein [Nocardia australiensis]|uniref:hypothetical protein n=1 Tax=Nocardia australiensis TaxID=2887191 RepID=UPI001D14D817|nr:hypothetical protein [Nocardia australiensis]
MTTSGVFALGRARAHSIAGRRQSGMDGAVGVLLSFDQVDILAVTDSAANIGKPIQHWPEPVGLHRPPESTLRWKNCFSFSCSCCNVQLDDLAEWVVTLVGIEVDRGDVPPPGYPAEPRLLWAASRAGARNAVRREGRVSAWLEGQAMQRWNLSIVFLVGTCEVVQHVFRSYLRFRRYLYGSVT